MLRRSLASMLLLAVTCIGAASPTHEGTGTPQSQPLEDVPIEAIWRSRQFSLNVRASGSYYPCGSLREKITAILVAVGAKEVAVDLICNMSRLTNNTIARVFVMAPVAATPENIKAATTFDSRAELVARLREVELPTATDIDRFPARWRTISLSRERRLHIDAGDCDLLRSISEQILPHLSVHVVKQRFVCPDTRLRRSRPTLVVLALVPQSA